LILRENFITSTARECFNAVSSENDPTVISNCSQRCVSPLCPILLLMFLLLGVYRDSEAPESGTDSLLHASCPQAPPAGIFFLHKFFIFPAVGVFPSRVALPASNLRLLHIGSVVSTGCSGRCFAHVFRVCKRGIFALSSPGRILSLLLKAPYLSFFLAILQSLRAFFILSPRCCFLLKQQVCTQFSPRARFLESFFYMMFFRAFRPLRTVSNADFFCRSFLLPEGTMVVSHCSFSFPPFWVSVDITSASR